VTDGFAGSVGWRVPPWQKSLAIDEGVSLELQRRLERRIAYQRSWTSAHVPVA
jgi:hypothetical protein